MDEEHCCLGIHSQQPLHGHLFPVLLSELIQGAVVPAQRSEQHVFGLLFHTTVEQRLCSRNSGSGRGGALWSYSAEAVGLN